MNELKREVYRCHNCGRYYGLSESCNTSCCSKECTKEYIEYLTEDARKNNREFYKK